MYCPFFVQRITWKDADTPKKFEEYIHQHLKASISKDITFDGTGTGSCLPCSNGCIRYCVDMKGTYQQQKFVIDAKFYQQGTFISKGDILKLERDKNEFEAAVGFLVTYAANVSSSMARYASAKKVLIISVRNQEGNPTHWIEDFISKF